jgi:hypothetical protein
MRIGDWRLPIFDFSIGNRKSPIGNLVWGCSSDGRAPALQAGGQRFDSAHLHHESVLRVRVSPDRVGVCSLTTE